MATDSVKKAEHGKAGFWKIAGALLLFLMLLAGGFWLLWIGKFTGGDFVAFFGLSALVGFVVGLVPYVEEFSIGKNVVKLREATADAKGVVSRLNQQTLSLYRALLREYQRPPAEEPYLPVVDNVSHFMVLYKDIQAITDHGELDSAVAITARSLLQYQLIRIRHLHPAVPLNGVEIIPPDMLREKVMDPAFVDRGRDMYIYSGGEENRLLSLPYMQKDEWERALSFAVDAYKDVYEIREKHALSAT
jgi:hypothetical protein